MRSQEREERAMQHSAEADGAVRSCATSRERLERIDLQIDSVFLSDLLALKRKGELEPAACEILQQRGWKW